MITHADWSSAMGYCCQLRCMHAANAWQMGWAQAVSALDAVTLLPGQLQQFVLPAQLTARKSFVSVTTNWMPDPALVGAGNSSSPTPFASSHTFWISYRPITLPYDVAEPGYINGVFVHV